MSTRIRLSRTGSKNRPFFKIVVTVAGVPPAVDTIYEVGTIGVCDINCCLGAKTKELLACKCIIDSFLFRETKSKTLFKFLSK